MEDKYFFKLNVGIMGLSAILSSVVTFFGVYSSTNIFNKFYLITAGFAFFFGVILYFIGLSKTPRKQGDIKNG